MRFQFSLLRLLIATAAFAAGFAIGRCFGITDTTEYVLISSWIASGLSILVLVVKESDIPGIVHLVIYCGIGMFITFSFTARVHPPYEQGDEIRNMIVGAIIGWVIGLITFRLGYVITLTRNNKAKKGDITDYSKHNGTNP
jgi:hypothetical protein